MEEKKYLKWYNKIGYGSGDIAGNVVYAFLTFICDGISDRYDRIGIRYSGNTDCRFQITRWIYRHLFWIND